MLSLDASNLETSPDQAQKWQVSMLDRQKVNIPGHVHVHCRHTCKDVEINTKLSSV